MPRLTAYFDVDLTLVDIDGELLPHVEKRLREASEVKGYKMICWSQGGGDYAKRICERTGIAKYFTLFLDKPDFLIDDNPEGILDHSNVIRVTGKDFWEKFWEKIFRKEVY